MAPNNLTSPAGRPPRTLRPGRHWLSPLLRRLSPVRSAIMGARRLEDAGRLDEALAAWKMLKGTRVSRAATFRLTLRRARAAMQAGDWAEAVKDFGALFTLDPHDVRAIRGLESAALRGARQAQTKGHWIEACRMWAAFGRASTDIDKCVKNMRDCARYVAQSADSTEKMADALEGWRLLKAVDEDSREAQQGMEWCHLSLARDAERASDHAGARAHWNALLELSPGDQRALDGLKRLSAEGA